MSQSMSNTELKATKKKKNEALETIVVVVEALLIALLFRTFLYQPFSIPTASMQSTLMIGDYFIANKWAWGFGKYSFPVPLPFSGRFLEFGQPQRGDIAVFHNISNEDYIKRVIGLPGDTIQMKAGRLYINGTMVEREEIGKSTDTDSNMTFIIAKPATATARSSSRLLAASGSPSPGASPIGCASNPNSAKAPTRSGISASGVQAIWTRFSVKLTRAEAMRRSRTSPCSSFEIQPAQRISGTAKSRSTSGEAVATLIADRSGSGLLRPRAGPKGRAASGPRAPFRARSGGRPLLARNAPRALATGRAGG